jgi:hypothetical protein
MHFRYVYWDQVNWQDKKTEEIIFALKLKLSYVRGQRQTNFSTFISEDFSQ